MIAFHGREVTRGGADIQVMPGNNQEPGSSPSTNELHYGFSVTAPGDHAPLYELPKVAIS